MLLWKSRTFSISPLWSMWQRFNKYFKKEHERHRMELESGRKKTIRKWRKGFHWEKMHNRARVLEQLHSMTGSKKQNKQPPPPPPKKTQHMYKDVMNLKYCALPHSLCAHPFTRISHLFETFNIRPNAFVTFVHFIKTFSLVIYDKYSG